MSQPRTVADLLALGREDDPAIGGLGRPPLTPGGLRRLAERTRMRLNEFGIGRDDRVAIILPNGPEMATIFLAVACTATTAPLNPALKLQEFEFYLGDLQAKAVIVQSGTESVVRSAAAACHIPIIELEVGDGAAGDFSLRGPNTIRVQERPAAPDAPGPNDVALILHTSGTTARPKIVPLTQSNVVTSAINIAHTLSIEPGDVCLNIMPLFHIHGLIAALLASMSAGASVVCTPGLNAFRFFNWCKEVRPTWYTAVPTMHQTLLELAPRHRDTIAVLRLRFIRSSSASLPPHVMALMEETFGVPVIEAYGMTEAAHQMASNPLPPGARQAGSVGRAAGTEIAIMDELGTLLPPGQIGEVVVRGGNVTFGYENNAEANSKSFAAGWFRTGDQGRLDQSGYLWLTGRLKEIINRGGEKISPLEVDNLLLEHESVQQVVTFAMPSRLFGEAVAAAVVLREGATADAEELRRYAGQRLAPFKVPERIVFVDEIPKSATGKLQRIGLAEKLGLVE